MKTTDESGNPLSPLALLKEIDKRGALLYAFASNMHEDRNDQLFEVDALVNGVIAFIHDIDEALKAAEEAATEVAP